MSVTLLTLLPHSRSTSYRHQGACPPFALSQCSCAPSRLTLTCESKRVTGESMSENEIFVGSGYLLASGHVSSCECWEFRELYSSALGSGEVCS